MSVNARNKKDARNSFGFDKCLLDPQSTGNTLKLIIAEPMSQPLPREISLWSSTRPSEASLPFCGWLEAGLLPNQKFPKTKKQQGGN